MLNSPFVTRLIDLALDEDLSFGDITSQLCVVIGQAATAQIFAKEPLIFCGEAVVQQVLWRYAATHQPELRLAGAPAFEIDQHKGDGESVTVGECIATISADSQSLLAIERTVLNFIQRLSGIATQTREVVSDSPGSLKILDTRKTTPGWRVLEKYAVKVGGAENHRFSLGDMILVKNNHIDLRNGDIDSLLTDVFSNKPIYMPVEVEVRDLAELGKALPYKPTIVMLDNMGTEMIVQAVKLVHQFKASSGFAPMIEVSGGITKERLQELAQSGVDAVSMGALTHQARAVDISMKVTAVS